MFGSGSTTAVPDKMKAVKAIRKLARKRDKSAGKKDDAAYGFEKPGDGDEDMEEAGVPVDFQGSGGAGSAEPRHKKNNGQGIKPVNSDDKDFENRKSPWGNGYVRVVEKPEPQNKQRQNLFKYGNDPDKFEKGKRQTDDNRIAELERIGKNKERRVGGDTWTFSPEFEPDQGKHKLKVLSRRMRIYRQNLQQCKTVYASRIGHYNQCLENLNTEFAKPSNVFEPKLDFSKLLGLQVYNLKNQVISETPVYTIVFESSDGLVKSVFENSEKKQAVTLCVNECAKTEKLVNENEFTNHKPINIGLWKVKKDSFVLQARSINCVHRITFFYYKESHEKWCLFTVHNNVMPNASNNARWAAFLLDDSSTRQETLISVSQTMKSPIFSPPCIQLGLFWGWVFAEKYESKVKQVERLENFSCSWMGVYKVCLVQGRCHLALAFHPGVMQEKQAKKDSMALGKQYTRCDSPPRLLSLDADASMHREFGYMSSSAGDGWPRNDMSISRYFTSY